MYAKSICLTCAALLLTLVGNTYGVVIGDWENSDDGWVIVGPEGTTMSYSDTNGVTLNNYSLKLSVVGRGWQNGICIKLQEHPELIPVFRKNNKIRFDVTRLAAEWTGAPADGHSGIHIVINAGGDGWEENVWDDLGYKGWWKYDLGDNTQTIEYDYSASLPKINFDTVWWLEIWFISNCDDGYTSDPIYYIDNFQIPTTTAATLPSPEDGQADLDRNVDLSWKPGEAAASHHLYFGTDAGEVNDVNIATLGSYPNVTFSPLDVNTWDPGTLELGKTYYWRIDEANDPDLWKGELWSFTVGTFLVVDDFEDYNDWTPGRIFETWLDGFGYGTQGEPPYYPGNGTGSIVGYDTPPFTENVIVHGGGQAMPYYYDTDQKYAEATADVAKLDISPNWYELGVRALSLRFYGDPCNTTAKMYVMLEDGDAKTDIVYYDGDMSDVTVAAWHEWRIALSAFEQINPTNVAKISIGFGTRGNTTESGGPGGVLFDDIRLYRPECMLDKRTAGFAKLDYAPLGNPGGDCTINAAELEIMAADWLLTDSLVSTQPPGAAGLVARYRMDDGTGDTVIDDLFLHDGTIQNGAQWTSPGFDGAGSAINIPGTAGGRVDIGTWDPSAGTGRLTVALWIKWAGPHALGDHQGLVGKRDTWGADEMMWFFELNTGNGINQLQFRQYATAATDVYTPNNLIDAFIHKWAHVAATFDGTTARVYLNGVEIGAGPFVFGPTTDATMAIGNTHGTAWGGSTEVFNGDIDEVLLYNKALIAAEVAYLADLTPADGQLHVPVGSKAELSETEDPGLRKVDFKDFAVLAQSWLDAQFWPWE